MSEKEYIDYFTDLASQHTVIKHSETDPRVFVASDNNQTELKQKLRNVKPPVLVLDQYYDGLNRSMDNFRQRVIGGISVLVSCKATDPDDVRRARDEARTIALQFINRMCLDCLSPRGKLFARKIQVHPEFDGEPVEVIGGVMTGWGYPFDWILPTSVVVDKQVWADL